MVLSGLCWAVFSLVDHKLCKHAFHVNVKCCQFMFWSISQIESETNKKTLSNLEKILSDYRAMKQENMVLLSRIQDTWRLICNTHHRMIVGSDLFPLTLLCLWWGRDMESEQGSAFQALCIMHCLTLSQSAACFRGGGENVTPCAIFMT